MASGRRTWWRFPALEAGASLADAVRGWLGWERQLSPPPHPGATGWFQMAVEWVPAAMVAVDREGRIAFVNVEAERLFGYRRDELVGKPIEVLVPIASRVAHRDARSAYLADPTARPMGVGRDLFALRKDGVEVPVEVGLSPLTTPEGTFVLSAVIDISARKRGEQLLREADHRKDEFLAMVAHELRNPLGALANALQLLRLGVHVDDARLLAERQLTQLTRIVDELADAGRLARGKMTPQMEVLEPPAAPGVVANPPAPKSAGGGLRLLLVDDNEDILETLAPLLRARGHEVRSVVDGPAALELAATYAPDAVLLDIGLPGMDGYEVARRLRRQARGLTLVALTGYGSEQDRQRARDAGIDQHLTKPVDLELLEGILGSLRSLPPP